jgi:predicted DNA-binding protein with PD1-like motif
MKIYSLRLKPHQDLRIELLNFAKEKNIKAGSIVTCVGALKPSVLRMAGAKPNKQDIRKYEDTHEIVSFVGTLTGDNCHLHISLSDKDGHVIGGHLKDGSLVDLTAEIVIVEDEMTTYTREFDEQTGFPELTIK